MQGLILTLSLLCFGLTYGYSRFKREIPNGYSVRHPCPGKGHWDAVGHMSGGYTPQKNVFGENFRDGGKRWNEALCRMDSDGDGLTNGEELGDPQCKWRPGDPTPGPVRGHPGFCEQDRQKCDSGMTHSECPNPRARGRERGRGRERNRTVPPSANDHPQTFLSKNLGQSGGIGQDLTRFDIGRPSFPGDRGMGGPMGDRFGMSDRGFGGQSPRQSGGFDQQSFQPTARPSFPSFDSRSDSGSFSVSGLSQDFGVPSGRFMGSPSGMDRMPSMDRTSGIDRTSGSGFMTGRVDYPMRDSFGIDRFSSSLDQRSIQGMGSPSSGPSFQSSMTQGDIERSVQARMGRVRSLNGDGGRMTSGARESSSMSFGPDPRGMSSGGIGSSMGRGFIRPRGRESMGSAGMDTGMMMGSGSMVPMSPSSMMTGFSGRMEGYPPVFGETSFSGERPSMSGGMMGRPGIFGGGPSGSMMGPFYPRF